jgi:hypothetical protein
VGVEVNAMNHVFTGEHPLQRLTIRHTNGTGIRVSYQASPEIARGLAETYKTAIGWPDATIEEGHDV